jgi:hypothetical protein
MSKRVVIPALALVIGLVFAINQVSAYGFGPHNEAMVAKFAEAFGKSEEEVLAVFDQLHEERELEMQSAFETGLNEAVASGEINEEQKQLILDKHAEMRLTHEEMREEQEHLTPDDWRATRQAAHDEMEVWAEENGIDISWIMGRGPDFGRRGMHRGMWGQGK